MLRLLYRLMLGLTILGGIFTAMGVGYGMDNLLDAPPLFVTLVYLGLIVLLVCGLCSLLLSLVVRKPSR